MRQLIDYFLKLITVIYYTVSLFFQTLMNKITSKHCTIKIFTIIGLLLNIYCDGLLNSHYLAAYFGSYKNLLSLLLRYYMPGLYNAASFEESVGALLNTSCFQDFFSLFNNNSFKKRYFVLKSYFYVFSLQAALRFLVPSPAKIFNSSQKHAMLSLL